VYSGCYEVDGFDVVRREVTRENTVLNMLNLNWKTKELRLINDEGLILQEITAYTGVLISA
jgi:hypothetical protein